MRTIENVAGAVYDEAKTTIIYAEDMNAYKANIEELASQNTYLPALFDGLLACLPYILYMEETPDYWLTDEVTCDNTSGDIMQAGVWANGNIGETIDYFLPTGQTAIIRMSTGEFTQEYPLSGTSEWVTLQYVFDIHTVNKLRVSIDFAGTSGAKLRNGGHRYTLQEARSFPDVAPVNTYFTFF